MTTSSFAPEPSKPASSPVAKKRAASRRKRLDWNYTIAHSIPGRLRLKSDELRWNSELGSAIITQLSACPSVTAIRINHWCAGLVMEYRASEMTQEEALALVENLKRPDGEEAVADISQYRSPQLPIRAPYVVPLLKRLISLAQRLMPGFVQCAVGAAAFAASVLQFPSAISRGLLFLSIAPIATRALETIVEEGRPGVDVLDGAAASLMLANGRIVEASFMTALIGLGEFIRERTARRCQKLMTDLLGLAGRGAWLVKGKKRVFVPADEVNVGDTIVVYPGDMVAIDGTVLSGEAAIDQSKLTGESIPVEVKKGDTVYASTVNVEGKIYVMCQATGGNTRAGLVLETMNSAPIHETKIQNYASMLADKLVVPIFIGAASCFVATRSLARLMTMLIFDFSTGIRIAAPTAVLSSMHRAGRHGILIKSGGALEKLANVDAIIFDKTGTLTTGEPRVTRVTSLNGICEDKILALTAGAEQRLHHPASRAIVKFAHHKGLSIPERQSSSHVRGMGVKATVEGFELTIGSRRLMEAESIALETAREEEMRIVKAGESLAYVAVNGELAGLISYSDHIRPEVQKAIHQLKRLGVRKLVMATGDNETAAKAVAGACGITDVVSRAFPEHKAELVKKLREEGYTVAVIGDGINDSPALVHADVAISLHGGTEAARHTADVVLTDDDLRRLPEAIKIARGAMGLVKQNLSLAVIPNSAGLGLAAFGLVGPAGATLLNNGSAIVAALNSLRPLYVNNWSQAE